MKYIRFASVFVACISLFACGRGGSDQTAQQETSSTPAASAPAPSATGPLGAPGVVAGIVFEDKNHNGAMDADESRLSGQTVLVTNPSATERVTSTTTNGEGRFEFKDLRDGELRVSVQVPKGYSRTNDDSFTVTVADDRPLREVYFGIARQ